jgi:hypothetical protein
MQWNHPEHPGSKLRLAYCTNLHPAGDLAGLIEGLRRVTLPLRDRLAGSGTFGVGPWLSAPLAQRLAAPDGRAELAELAAFLHGEGLDPFTFNAFPYGDFHRAGLKADVYRPTWAEKERVAFTAAVARVACALADALDAEREDAHLSISTHPGAYGEWARTTADLLAYVHGMTAAVRELAQLEQTTGRRVILSLEAEPHASATDNRELFGYLAYARAEIARAFSSDADAGEEQRANAFHIPARYLGACLDACHSAVSFEDPEAALDHAVRGGLLGKLQFSSALSLDHPADHPAARRQLLALDEARYLHQVVGRAGPRRRDASDLSALAADLDDPARAAEWLACDAWRCHFHVPVDLDPGDLDPESPGLGTTRAHADQLLALLLADPSTWTTPELHLEIETYTWDVLPSAARGPGDLVDGLEREYQHVIRQLQAAGWHPE